MYLFQISNYDDPAVDRETAELLHQRLDGALPHLWLVSAGSGSFDVDSWLDAAKNHRCDHCGRSRDHCRLAGVCPCSQKNAAAHTGILQKGGAESAGAAAYR